MEASEEEIRAFIPKIKASRSNLIDEIIYESRIQTELPHEKRDSEQLDKLFAELATMQIAIKAFEDEAEARTHL